MVTQCVCHRVPFAEIKRLAASGMSVAEISAQTKCCTGCGMCRPYVYVVLTTGATSIPVLSRSQSAELDARLETLLPRGEGKSGTA
ncbi:MAG: (2Fe-2S)-binding protein [Phycisphaerales bacterium]|nr:(2Fe-2S)-binding protein [Phycisphaerales bacterium]